MQISGGSLIESRVAAARLEDVAPMLIPLFLLLLQGASAPAPSNLDRAWAILDQAVASTDTDKRVKAVHALGLVPGNEKVVKMAEKALSDPNADVRTEAATALGKMNAESARQPLRDALNDNELKVQLAAASALYALKDPAAYDVYYAMLTGQRKSKTGLLQSQVDTLHDRKQMEKLAFETGIGFVPFGSMAYEAWKTISRDDSAAVLVQAVQRLATDADPKSEEAIRQATFDAKWQVRAAAVAALANRGRPSALDSVASSMQDENDAVVYEAAAAVIYLSGHPRPNLSSRPSPSQRAKPVQP